MSGIHYPQKGVSGLARPLIVIYMHQEAAGASLKPARKEHIVSSYTWTPAACFDGESAVLAADITDSIRAVLYIEYQDGLKVTLAIHGEDVHGRLDGVASTDRPEDWDEVERFIPRTEWPEEIYAGRRGLPSVPPTPPSQRRSPRLAQSSHRARRRMTVRCPGPSGPGHPNTRKGRGDWGIAR